MGPHASKLRTLFKFLIRQVTLELCMMVQRLTQSAKAMLNWIFYYQVRILRPGNPIPADVRPFVNKNPEMMEKVCALIEYERTEFALKAVRDFHNEQEDKMKVMVMLPLSFLWWCRKHIVHNVNENENLIIQWLQLIRITLGEHKSYNDNQMIPLTDVFCVVLRYKWASNFWLQ